ncbi:hypothetical protein [Streptomyces achromogenes]|uniref:hypothetical protein n=1 Tax=Streptomyces achromogenes TaxID=67255 RepID=UPI00370202BE
MASRVDEHQEQSTNGQHPHFDVATPTRPIFDLRFGGFRMTVERIPYRLLALASTASAFALGAKDWFIH